MDGRDGRMTSGRWLVLAILGLTAVFAAAQWYFQTRAYYAPVADAEIVVTNKVVLDDEILRAAPALRFAIGGS